MGQTKSQKFHLTVENLFRPARKRVTVFTTADFPPDTAHDPDVFHPDLRMIEVEHENFQNDNSVKTNCGEIGRAHV